MIARSVRRSIAWQVTIAGRGQQFATCSSSKIDQKEFESGMMLMTLQQLFKKLMVESYDDVHSGFKVKTNGANEVPMGCGQKVQ